MANSLIKLPAGYFPNPKKNQPLGLAKIYIGLVDQDPHVEANRKTVAGRQEDGTVVPLSQPVRTSIGGVPVDDNGNYVTLVVDGLYSMAVDDRNDNQVYYFPNTPSALIEGGNDGTGPVPKLQPRQLGDGVTTEFETPAEIFYDESFFFVYLDGVRQRPLTDYSIDSAGKVVFVEAPPESTKIDITFYSQVTTDFGENVVVADGSTTPRTLGNRFSDVINVRDYGATGDGVTDDTASFQLASNAADARKTESDRKPQILVPDGNFLITSDVTAENTWVVDYGARILGLPVIPPSNIDDTSHLLGTVIRGDGVNKWNTLMIGDPKKTVQKAASNAYIAELIVDSDNAAGGVAGTSYSSARDAVDLACIGVLGISINDNINTPKPTWGFYGEVRRDDDLTGNIFGVELTAMVKAGMIPVTSDPFTRPFVDSGVAFCSWLTAGGRGDGSYNTNITAYQGFLGKGGAKADKGLIVYDDSIETQITIEQPYSYSIQNTIQGSNFNSTRDGSKTSLYLASDDLLFSPRYEFKRAAGGHLTPVNGSKLGSITASAIQDGTTNRELSTINVFMRSGLNVDGDATTETVVQNSIIGGAGSKRGIIMTYSNIRPTDDGLLSCGTASERWSTVYAVNGTINTSDENYKTFLPVEEAEIACAKELKGAMRKYKWTDKPDGDARIHFGVGAQTVKSIMESNGLNPFDYGLLCYDDLEGGKGRYGIRYEELLCFIMLGL